MARPCSPRGKDWKMMAELMENIMAAPAAWKTRQRTRRARLVDRPQARELAVKMATPSMNILARPTYSATLPKMSSRLVSATR